MESFSKLVVFASAVAAVILQAFLLARGWSELPTVLVGGAVFAFVAAWRWPGAFHGGLVAFGYVAAAVWILALGRFYPAYLVVWMGALLAGMAARSGLRWNTPSPWHLPLVAWALVLAVSWPVVVLRELDFSFELLTNLRVANTAVGVSPAEAASGILEFSLIQIVGLLWFDWLWGAYAGQDPRRFERHILMPMGATALVACLVAVYQGVVDIQWLGRSGFPQLGRAGGTMVDPNAFGVVAALWAPVFLVGGMAAGARYKTPVLAWLGGAGLLIAAGGVWMSASRTALMALAIGVIGAAAAAVTAVSGEHGPPAGRRRRMLVLGALPAVLVLVLAIGVLTSSANRGPAERIRELVPSFSARGMSTLVDRLWNRGWYGPAAHLMIREHPIVGVGVGGYYILVEQYSRRVGRVVTIDNAQNWYRHQLAEFGLLGSLPWIVWVIVFARFLTRTRGEGDERLPAGGVKAVLVGLGVVSLVGMPAQNAAVALTFWTFVFWCIRLVSPPVRLPVMGTGVSPGPASRLKSGGTGMALVLVLVAAYAAGTTYAARGSLRVPYRAARGAGTISGAWNYAYGFHQAEQSPDHGEFRWTRARAVAVVEGEPKKAWMKLTVWTSHPDAGERPISARVWGYGRELVIDAERWDGAGIVAYLPVEYGRSMVETWVSRTFRPSNYGSEDTRELGLALAWEFVSERPDERAMREP